MPHKPEESERLSTPIAALRKGGSLANAVVESFTPRLYRFFRSLGADARNAEDLCQEVFLKLIRSEAEYEERGEFTAYIFRVAYHVWIDETRVRKPVVLASEENWVETLYDKEDFLEQLQDQEMQELLKKTLQKLPEEQRVAFELGVLQSMRYQEVADILGVPLGTVKSRIFTVANKLKEMLAERARLNNDSL